MYFLVFAEFFRKEAQRREERDKILLGIVEAPQGNAVILPFS